MIAGKIQLAKMRFYPSYSQEGLFVYLLFAVDEWQFNWLRDLVIPAGMLVVGGFITFWFKRTRINQVIVRELRNGEMIEVPAIIKKEITVSYLGLEVKNISHLALKVENHSPVVLENVFFNVFIPDEILVLSVTIDGVAGKYEMEQSSNGKACIKILIPFINQDKHGEFMKLTILTEKPIEEYNVEGRGKGWTIEYVSAASYYLRKLINLFTKTFIFTLAYSAIVTYVEFIDASERTFLSMYSRNTLTFFLMSLTVFYARARPKGGLFALLRKNYFTPN